LGVTNFSTAQNGKSFWTQQKLSVTAPTQVQTDAIQPQQKWLYQLDLNALKSVLSSVNQRSDRDNLKLNLPNADGGFSEYSIYEFSVLEPDFQVQFPNIRSYAGQGITNPSETLRFSITPKGFNAIILGGENGAQYIAPNNDGDGTYMVYYTKHLNWQDAQMECGVTDNLESREDYNENQSRNANDGILRNYRIAIACTGEYGTFHGGTIPDVVAAMTVSLTNVNAILERDLSVTMTLIDNSSIIFFDPSTDPFDNFDNGVLIDQSQNVINGNIGAANYDLGHVFNTAGGGVAQIASLCVDSAKARGVTGGSTPVGPRFDGVFAHELGHQFGSLHTFNGSTGSCGPNITPTAAYEPGSGSTIMAYPGLCGSQNVQVNFDFYYHQESLRAMWNIISSRACPTDQSVTGNSSPSCDAGPNYLIPRGTPYKLTGISSDTEGTSSHTYTWEQYDLGPAGAPTETTLNGPLVRSFEGTANPTRYIPRLTDLRTTGGSTDWEKLVAISRDITFRLTVRDNDARGGQNDFDEMVLNVTDAAGPFVVTSQDQSQIIWTPGSTETITWDVAGTDGNGINTSEVNILLSTDGGLNYDTILAENVPNDGSQDITVPNIDARQCRVMVESADNIFFNINSENFAVGNFTFTNDCVDFVFNINEFIPESGFYTLYNLDFQESVIMDDLNVNVDIAGDEDNGSIIYALRGPFQTNEIQVLSFYNCPGTVGQNWTFDDEGGAVNCSSTTNGDAIVPADPLSFADNEDAQGNWSFFIADVDVDGIRSNINTVTLNVCGFQLVPLSTEDLAFEDLRIFPNPNNGQFNLSFVPKSGDEIKVEVLDVLGRTVFSRQYGFSTSFNEQLNLSSVSKGLHFVKIKDGTREVVKKIIIK
jgi:hypothetical protein